MKACVSKDFRFEAAHQLTLVPAGHQCARLHGHSYLVRVECCGEIDPSRGWVVDYADISAATMPLIESLDHRFLNDVFEFETTAELLAFWFFERLRKSLPSLARVGVQETASTWVWVQQLDA